MAGKSVNKVTLIGNLGKDPEVKKLNSGKTIAKFSLATNESRKGQDGQYADHTEWHNLVLFDRLAEVAGEYAKKGNQIYVEGRIQTRSWEDGGVKKYMTEIVVNDLVLFGGKPPLAALTPPASPENKPISDEDIPF